MIELSIDGALRQAAPELTLGAVSAAVTVTKHSADLWKQIDRACADFQREVRLVMLPHKLPVKALKDAYHALGKDPSRYRSSAEALGRRILQGKGLYRVNTVVDINNLISLETLHSVGSYDLGKITPPVTFRVGLPGESYKGIGKELINIEELPVFTDSTGPFGSPTSDSERAMILESTRKVMVVIIAFSGTAGLEANLKRTAEQLTRYCSAQRIETVLIS